MTEPNHDYKAGSLVVFTEGEWSDFGLLGHFVVLRDMGLADLRAAAASGQDPTVEYGFGPEGMLAALIREGFLLALDAREIHLGGYGCCPEEFRPPAAPASSGDATP